MFIKNYFHTLLVIAAFGVYASGQQAQPTPPIEEDDRPVKITTSLIQLDVAVLDKKDGKPLTGLGPDDFTVLQDGKPQQISSVTYVDEIGSTRTAVSRKDLPKSERSITVPPSNIRSRQGRLITFVLDDGNCLATLQGTDLMRDAVKRFIRDQMLPDDRVAIYRTAGGASLIQAYTGNKDVLRRMVGRVSLLPSRSCGGTFDALRDMSTIKITGSGADSFENAESVNARRQIEALDRRNNMMGTIEVINFVTERLKYSPQRKTIFLVSEGIYADFKDDTFGAIRQLADKAARSSVVIHSISTKGLTIPGFLSAQDEVLPGIISGSDNTGPATSARLVEDRLMNEGLAYLANETGGRFIRNTNRLDVDIRQILQSQSGYYLVAYEPDEETFRGKAFHKIEVRVDKPDVIITSRSGFFGRTDKEAAPVYRNADSPLYQAIGSPFSETGIDVRLTLIYGNKTGSNDGHYLRSLMHIPGADLGLIDDAGGGKKAVLDVVSVVTDEKGKVVEEFNRSYPIRIPRAGVATVEQNGLDFSADTAIKKPGVYSYRIAVRNAATKRVGSAGDFVEVPDAKKRQLLAAGLIATTAAQDGKPQIPAERQINAAFAPIFTGEAPSVRRYSSGSSVFFAYSVYNSEPGVTREIRIYRDGKEISKSGETTITAQAVNGRIDDNGVIRIPFGLEPGEYAMQVIVRDRAGKRTSAQWVDIEVIA